MATNYTEYDPETNKGPYGAVLGYDSNKKKVYKKGKSLADGKEGVGAAWGNWQDLWTDFDRRVGNFGSSLDAWLASKPQPVAGGGAGDARHGRDPNSKLPYEIEAEKAAAQAAIPQAQAQPDIFKDLIDGYTDPFSGLISSTKQRGVENDSRLNTIFKSAADYIRGMQGDTNAVYDKAAQDYIHNNDASTNAVNAGYGVARDQQSRALKALGIEDAARTIAANGTDPSNDQVAATSRLADLLSTNLNLNTANRTGAVQSLLAGANGTMAQGARTRAMYQEQLANQIADLESKSSTSRNDYLTSIADSQAKAEASAATAKSPVTSDEYMTELNNAFTTFKGQGYDDASAHSAAQKYMEDWLKTRSVQ